jgi:hypothetical protein
MTSQTPAKTLCSPCIYEQKRCCQNTCCAFSSCTVPELPITYCFAFLAIPHLLKSLKNIFSWHKHVPCDIKHYFNLVVSWVIGCGHYILFLFLTHLFWGITYRLTNLQSPSECGIPRPVRTQSSRCGNTLKQHPSYLSFDWSPIQVLTGHNFAWLRWSNGHWYVQRGKTPFSLTTSYKAHTNVDRLCMPYV